MTWSRAICGLGLAALTGWAVAQSPTSPNGNGGALDSDPHLLGWWKFDETTGTNAVDSSAKKHPAALVGGMSFETDSVPGRVGTAIRFTGKEGYVRVTDWKGITGQSPRTIAAWIKATAPDGSIVSWGADEPGKMWTFGYVRGRMGLDPKGGYFYMKAPTHDDVWHHVAIVMQEASPPNLHDNVKLFKDGELAEIDDIGMLDLWPLDSGDKRDVTIGRRFKGAIDDLRIYDRSLSEEEINALFKKQGDRPADKSK